jgi:hypothetical protein
MRSELAMATRGSICPARPKSDFLTSLIFRVFQTVSETMRTLPSGRRSIPSRMKV